MLLGVFNGVILMTPHAPILRWYGKNDSQPTDTESDVSMISVGLNGHSYFEGYMKYT